MFNPPNNHYRYEIQIDQVQNLNRKKEILEFIEDAYGQWIVYQNKQPKFHIDCFDFKSESNQILNSWLLAQQKSIKEVLDIINRKNKTNLTIEKAPLLEIKVDSKIKEIRLDPLPLEWVS